MARRKLKRYYLVNSSVFNNPRNNYDLALFKRIIRGSRGVNIREAYAYGWRNQPRVVTFSAAENDLFFIEDALNNVPPFLLVSWPPIIHVKDW